MTKLATSSGRSLYYLWLLRSTRDDGIGFGSFDFVPEVGSLDVEVDLEIRGVEVVDCWMAPDSGRSTSAYAWWME